MEQTTLTEDILVYCITATSFPDGILQAHQSLHALVPFDPQRKYFGLSWPDGEGIIYKAAAAELHEGELSQHNLETKLIESGNYLYIDIPDFMKNTQAIGIAFDELIHNDDIAPDGFCIEWYKQDDLCRCMVRRK